MLFSYEAIDAAGSKKKGNIDAINESVAISSLQRRGLIIISIAEKDKKGGLNVEIALFQHVSNKELVILSRQIATLFEAQVSALRIFRLLGAEAENKLLGKILTQVGDDLQAGSTISDALAKHPKVFSQFYVNMIRSGEESGKLEYIFGNLADYMDRTYEVASKARNALIYPSFIIATFFAVMTLMMVLVIPNLARILVDSGQTLPIYTRITIAISNLLINYGFFILAAFIVAGFLAYRYSQTEEGSYAISGLRMSIPYLGNLYEKLYLSRIADNLSTMLESGIPMVRAIELTGGVVGSRVYEEILLKSAEDVKAGSSISAAFGKHEEIPGIIVQMVKVGEESGELGKILKTMAAFYRREVNNAVDTLIDMIEPLMIVLLGLGVGSLLASVLIPIYNVAGSIS